MEALNLFGFIISATIGMMAGASMMYFSGLIIDNIFDKRTEEDK